MGGVVVGDKTTFSFSLYSLVMFKVKNPQMTLSDSIMAGSILTQNVRMKCIALRKCWANHFCFFLRTNVISNVYKFCYSNDKSNNLIPEDWDVIKKKDSRQIAQRDIKNINLKLNH